MFERSWFWSRREVSAERSTSESSRSVTNPAMRMRRKAETSSFDCRGVSTGTSSTDEHPSGGEDGEGRGGAAQGPHGWGLFFRLLRFLLSSASRKRS